MPLIAGIDIGNATTEVALAQDGRFIGSGIVATTGMKGTRDNIAGVVASLQQALNNTPWSLQDVAKICINEAAPVIGDVAMETITETIITESTMIGHNPQTPGGVGVGMGTTIAVEKLAALSEDRFAQGWIPLVGEEMDFLEAVWFINEALDRGVNVVAAILKKDDGVLVNNRLHRPMPVVDEVTLLEKVPEGVLAAVEVAAPGQVVRVLSNPYGIATFFALTPEETQTIVPIARALIGNRSAVVLKTPQGDVQSRVIPAGKIFIRGEKRGGEADVAQGAQAIMQAMSACAPVRDIGGEAGTHAGGMLERVRKVMASLTGHDMNTVHIQDLLAVDTFIPRKVQGGIAGECSMENAVGIAAMVKADRLQMQAIASELSARLNTPVEVGGVEANMAVAGALTTPGCAAPLAILDLGAGSTDAAIINSDGVVRAVHLAGAGNMVSLLIQTELGLNDAFLAEEIKKYPLAKVESLFSIRHENGAVEFFREPLSPTVFAKVVYLKEGELIPVDNLTSLEKIRLVRRQAKEKVFVTNCLRALLQVSPSGSIRDIAFVVLVGGSSLDFEIPQMITDALAHYGVVAGQGNIRGSEGPRNAVATGLVLAGMAN
ncbi:MULTISPECIES: diol dehydratase reactivase subunit alpha [Citrobacter freundii complex]|uniref:Glycerol dehydratase reactivation factor large subunit n=3 Tax=Citrobacter freundii TaxID=546 RepID=A0A7G2IX50_CITFR|nr:MULTISPECIES: diol dehydratase reactivase subunit alpha [Citrobacter freundii complex]AUU27857.1 diol dehydratase reactivase subunit alpha [Citrobacter freundii]AYL43888.1 diol dehydratase reactivase subunit alpha [Citrobacter freundii]EKT8563481.1 diol dehydratase reactivase subunit alpha [Citrobacter freundii]EKU0824124.1 diol dehydratase reactivase subunit alpha [Citrobacter freundii]EKU6851588.1 diol dehydratase reactivase subunit alpha [Citrobacter freundii]